MQSHSPRLRRKAKQLNEEKSHRFFLLRNARHGGFARAFGRKPKTTTARRRRLTRLKADLASTYAQQGLLSLNIERWSTYLAYAFHNR
jgi:hypothetical protein